MNESVKILILVCAVCAVASSLIPAGENDGSRALKFLCSVLIIICIVSPVTSAFHGLNSAFDGAAEETEEATEENDGYSVFENSVLERTAGAISDYTRRFLADKYGFPESVRISVLFDGDDRGIVNLSEIQIFSGIRIDSYLDREIEEKLSDSLGCKVFIFSE